MTTVEAVKALLEAKVKQHEIAAEAGCTQGLISQLVTGKVADVRYSVGCRILAMHGRVCGAVTTEQKAA